LKGKKENTAMALTKNDLMNSLHQRLKLRKCKSLELLESLLEIMKKRLESGEDVRISGFGKFSVKDKRERRGRNPQSGEDLMLEPRRVVTFRCSEVFRNKINGRSD
jgi:integration host factor subunit alpha